MKSPNRFRPDFPQSKVPETGLLIEDVVSHRNDQKALGVWHPVALIDLADSFARMFRTETVDEQIERLL